MLKSFCDKVLLVEAKHTANCVYLSMHNLNEHKLNIFFDHSVSIINQIIIEKLKTFKCAGLHIFSLPHGFCAITNSMTSFSSNKPEVIPKTYNIYDKVITSDQVQYENFLNGGVAKNKLVLLESLKYTREWADYFDFNFSNKLHNRNKSKVKILIIMTKFNANISKNEFFRTMKIILNAHNIEILIKPHPRGSYDLILMKRHFKGFSQVRYHQGHIHDAIKYSDIVLSLPSSAIIDANLDHKPILYLPYLTSSTLNPYLTRVVNIFNNPNEFYIIINSLEDNLNNISIVNLNFNKFDEILENWNASLLLNLRSNNIIKKK
ncbi:hypothetical protein N8477_06175 [Candidatus Thioglobus sp.]|nr:hypothetical protein [Candidatus Thioglobus sp.]